MSGQSTRARVVALMTRCEASAVLAHPARVLVQHYQLAVAAAYREHGAGVARCRRAAVDRVGTLGREIAMSRDQIERDLARVREELDVAESFQRLLTKRVSLLTAKRALLEDAWAALAALEADGIVSAHVGPDAGEGGAL